jgi:hypothetical protein
VCDNKCHTNIGSVTGSVKGFTTEPERQTRDKPKLGMHHERHRCDGLRHRIDAVHGVVFDRKRSLDITHAVAVLMRNLPVARDHQVEARQATIVHVLLEVLVQQP